MCRAFWTAMTFALPSWRKEPAIRRSRSRPTGSPLSRRAGSPPGARVLGWVAAWDYRRHKLQTLGPVLFIGRTRYRGPELRFERDAVVAEWQRSAAPAVTAGNGHVTRAGAGALGLGGGDGSGGDGEKGEGADDETEHGDLLVRLMVCAAARAVCQA